jgi:hypothetical protein
VAGYLAQIWTFDPTTERKRRRVGEGPYFHVMPFIRNC